MILQFTIHYSDFTVHNFLGLSCNGKVNHLPLQDTLTQTQDQLCDMG
jgi:hypothetical protein